MTDRWVRNLPKGRKLAVWAMAIGELRSSLIAGTLRPASRVRGLWTSVQRGEGILSFCLVSLCDCQSQFLLFEELSHFNGVTGRKARARDADKITACPSSPALFLSPPPLFLSFYRKKRKRKVDYQLNSIEFCAASILLLSTS